MMLARTKDAHGIFSSWLFTSLHFIRFSLSLIHFSLFLSLYICSVQLFGRLFQSGIGDRIEMGMQWLHKYRSYFSLLGWCVRWCHSLSALVQI